MKEEFDLYEADGSEEKQMEHQRRQSRSLDKAALFFAACQDGTLRHDVVKQI